MTDNDQYSRIMSSCYFTRNTSGENFIPEHMFSYQISGSLTINDGKNVITFKEGDFRLSIRNKLVKYIKQPPLNGEFRSLSVAFDKETLRSVSLEYGYEPGPHQMNEAVILLKQDVLYKNYVDSIMPFLPLLPDKDDVLMNLKLKEAVLTLLKVQPELKNILFDFSDPNKIDIEAYMEKNFKFNLSLSRFAYMTGRSVSSFKRDFEKVFGTSPGRWLLYRRLKEAYFLMKDKGERASAVYIEVGFEDLSHFSRSFKKEFGVMPSKIDAY